MASDSCDGLFLFLPAIWQAVSAWAPLTRSTDMAVVATAIQVAAATATQMAMAALLMATGTATASEEEEQEVTKCPTSVPT